VCASKRVIGGIGFIFTFRSCSSSTRLLTTKKNSLLNKPSSRAFPFVEEKSLQRTSAKTINEEREEKRERDSGEVGEIKGPYSREDSKAEYRVYHLCSASHFINEKNV